MVGILLTNLVAAVSVLSDKSTIQRTESIVISCESPRFEKQDEYVFVKYPQATSYLLLPGEPALPVMTHSFEIPFDSSSIDVDVKTQSMQSVQVTDWIAPAPKAVVEGSGESGKVPPDTAIYESSDLYPTQEYNVDVKVGLVEDQSTMFVSVRCYPFRYQPSEDRLYYPESIEITLTYKTEQVPTNFPDEYDLLIISPAEFSSALQPLVDHKNASGMSTLAVTLEEIYASGVGGRDDQETIKLYIKEAKETMGITYVMIVGGRIGQSYEWYVPVRYGHSPSEEAYLSDLYYADLYKYENNETVFEDWDSNGNGRFAEYGFTGRDDIDGSPDVYIGRLACRDIDDVNIIVQKIISYEQRPADDSWFKKMLLIGGDTYPESPIAFEAEIDTNLSSTYMPGFTIQRLWASEGTLTGREDVEEAFSQGCGFIHMAGHANPASLVTFPPYDSEKEEKIIIMAMYDISNFPHMNPRLSNAEKQPVVLIGGCHNSQYNVTFANMITGIQEYGLKGYFFSQPYRFFYMEWVPKCFSWWLTIQEDGGAIATFGNTGLGMGIWDYDYLTGLDGWLFPRFFYHYGMEGKEHIGMAQGAAINDYVNEFDINADGEDRQMIQQWALLGDPSLLPGGYE